MPRPRWMHCAALPSPLASQAHRRDAAARAAGTGRRTEGASNTGICRRRFGLRTDLCWRYGSCEKAPDLRLSRTAAEYRVVTSSVRWNILGLTLRLAVGI